MISIRQYYMYLIKKTTGLNWERGPLFKCWLGSFVIFQEGDSYQDS